MSEIVCNESPVRTSQNYHINHIVLKDLPSFHKEMFESVVWKNWDDKKVIISEEMNDFHLAHGMGESFEKAIQQDANFRYKIVLKENSENENVIQFIFDEDNSFLMDYIEVEVQENVRGKITIQYLTKGNKESGFHNGVIRTLLHDHAILHMTVINQVPSQATNLLAIENTLEEKATLQFAVVDFGGKNSVTNYYSNLKGDDSENVLNSIYLGTQEQLLDINYLAEMRGKRTKMDMDVQGALKDNAKKHFKGTIDFKRGCQKAIGSENEFCMLLSDEAKSISLPMLLCDEEDVVGNHATAAGKVNNDELFYMMSRGLEEKDAKTLLVKARFHKVLDQIIEEEIKAKVLIELHRRLFA